MVAGAEHEDVALLGANALGLLELLELGARQASPGSSHGTPRWRGTSYRTPRPMTPVA